MATTTQTVTVIARPGKIVTDQVTITMHAVRQEDHNLSNTITDHPVEEGFNASDHSRPNPDMVSWQATISNTPLSTKQTTEAVRSGNFKFQTTQGQASGAIGATDGFAYGEWKKLRKLRDEGTIIKVVTTLETYDSMAIESISVPRNAKNYDAVQFSITFKKIRVVTNALTTSRTPKSPQAAKKKSTGHQTDTAATSKDEDPLLDLADSMSKSGNKTLSGAGNFLLSGGSGGQSTP